MGIYVDQYDELVAAQAKRREEIKAWARQSLVGVPQAFSFEQDFEELAVETSDEELPEEIEAPEAQEESEEPVEEELEASEEPVEDLKPKKETAAQRKKREAAEKEVATED